ncbi:MAG: OmpA family protein [Terriglobales bacterium]
MIVAMVLARRPNFLSSCLIVPVLLGGMAVAQAGTQAPGTTPIYRVTVVARTTAAINYRVRHGFTKVDFHGTPLLPGARGSASVQSQNGRTYIKADFDNMTNAGQFGPEYLTYVLWAITPEGRAANLGEVLLDGKSSSLHVTTDLQAFAMIVTAEPYFAVTQPSNVVVMENIAREDTAGKVETVNAKYELLERGQYTVGVDPSKITPLVVTPKAPLELYEARNALRIAQWAGADQTASDTYQKAQRLLQQANDYQTRNAGVKPVAMIAREAAQTAEDARVLTIKRRTAQNVADKQQQAAAETAEAQQQAASAQQQAAAEAEQRRQAEAAQAAAQAAQQQAQAETAQAREQAAAAEKARQQAEAEKTALRARLLQQLNLILETRDTARGLIVNMSDVLFDSGKYTLRPAAREKLAKISGVLLTYPGLKLAVEGHTDSVGTDLLNQELSQKRADTVRAYLIAQGIAPDGITSQGFGKANPVASNDTAAGRQLNRRVELIISGEAIGSALTAPAAPAPPTP